MQNDFNLWRIKNIDCVDNEDYYIKQILYEIKKLKKQIGITILLYLLKIWWTTLE